MIDPLTGEFPVTPRESRKAKRARVRATEASKRGKRSQRVGRRAERATLRWFESLAAECGHREWVKDYRPGEAAGGVTGADWAFLCPRFPLCGQTKNRQGFSLPAAWAKLEGARRALHPDTVPVLEGRYRTIPARDLRHVVHVAYLPLEAAGRLRVALPTRVVTVKRLEIRHRWAENPDGFVLRLAALPPLLVLDWAAFLTRYREAVTR